MVRGEEEEEDRNKKLPGGLTALVQQSSPQKKKFLVEHHPPMGERWSAEAPSLFPLLFIEYSCLQGAAHPPSLQQVPIIFGAYEMGNHHILPPITARCQDSFVPVS